jgi:hypothetical protein
MCTTKDCAMWAGTVYRNKSYKISANAVRTLTKVVFISPLCSRTKYTWPVLYVQNVNPIAYNYKK